MVRDVALQRRVDDLVAGTFGRGIFILDDYSVLRHITPIGEVRTIVVRQLFP